MSLVINHNLMAINTARNLSNAYGALATSTQRLSTGLRINSAADDAAGLAIREMMRSDIATLQQGIRNAADGISLLQTAEGALAIIDEKLTRMKELAEQAATGTYSTVQREIINSEYQAMAAEIDRIAASTEFNGVKLLDGSVNQMHDGKGLKIHFGLGNSENEDYYFINIPDMRSTTSGGLRVGGDATNDIWGTVADAKTGETQNCCGGGIPSLDGVVSAWNEGDIFAFGYNWDHKEDVDTNLTQGRYLAGAYQADATPTLEELVAAVNAGSQARVRIDIATGTTLQDLISHSALVASGDNHVFKKQEVLNAAQADALNASNITDASGNALTSGAVFPSVLNSAQASALTNSAQLNPNGTTYSSGDMFSANVTLSSAIIEAFGLSSLDTAATENAHRICIGDEIYYYGSASLASEAIESGKTLVNLLDYASAGTIAAGSAGSAAVALAAEALTRAINASAGSSYWAKLEETEYRLGYTTVYVFYKEGGERDTAACDEQLGDISSDIDQKNKICWYNDEDEVDSSAGIYFNNGGKAWGTLKAVPTGYGTFGVQLHGQHVGDQRDLWIANVGQGEEFDLNTDPAVSFTGLGFGARHNANGELEGVSNYYSLSRDNFVEIQNASDGHWDGAHLRTQSAAQEALEALDAAISGKDAIRAALGAYQNRLENTITNLEIYTENLQAAESRISDVNIATEMTEFIKNQVLVQAGVSMLSQANALPQMALSLLNG